MSHIMQACCKLGLQQGKGGAGGGGWNRSQNFQVPGGVTLDHHTRICRSSGQRTKLARGAEDSSNVISCGLAGLARDTENRIQPQGEDRAGKS